MRKILLASFLFLTLSSCIVTKKKYDELLTQKIRTEAELTERSLQLDSANSNIRNLLAQISSLKNDTVSLGMDKRATAQRLATLEKEYAQLNIAYKNLMTSSVKLNRDLTQQKEQLLAIQANLEDTRRLNDSLSVSLSEREK